MRHATPTGSRPDSGSHLENRRKNASARKLALFPAIARRNSVPLARDEGALSSLCAVLRGTRPLSLSSPLPWARQTVSVLSRERWLPCWEVKTGPTKLLRGLDLFPFSVLLREPSLVLPQHGKTTRGASGSERGSLESTKPLSNRSWRVRKRCLLNFLSERIFFHRRETLVYLCGEEMPHQCNTAWQPLYLTCIHDRIMICKVCSKSLSATFSKTRFRKREKSARHVAPDRGFQQDPLGRKKKERENTSTSHHHRRHTSTGQTSI